MFRATSTLAGVILGVAFLVVIGRAQDAADSEPRPFPTGEQTALPESEPTAESPPASRPRSKYGEPTPAVRPSKYASEPTPAEEPAASVVKRPSAADRLQQVREATNRPAGPRATPRGAAVLGPVTSDPANVRQPSAAESTDSEPSRTGRGKSVLKKSPSATISDEPPTARRSLRAPSTPEPTPARTAAAPKAVTSPPANIKSVGAARPSAPLQTILESRSPAVRVETVGPKAVKSGSEATYVIHVHNDGDVEANDVFVRAGLPTSAKVVAEGATAETGSSNDVSNEQRVVWTISRLAARGSETLTLRVTPTTNAPLDLYLDWTIRPISAVAQIAVQQPQLEMAVFGPKDIAYGQAAKYTIRLTNPGNGDAEDVMVEFGYGQEKLEPKRVGSLLAGQSQEVSLELTARQAGALPVVAVASAAGGLRAEATQELLVRRAAIEVEVSGDTAVFSGSPAKYRVVVRNAGNAPATQVVAVVTLPDGSKLVRSGDDSKPAQKGLVWNLATLPPNGERTLDLECVLTTAGENAVRVEVAAATDLETAGSTVTRVEALADLKLAVNDPQGPVAVGQDAVYEIRIANRGTKAATKVNVIAQFSPGIEPIEATGAKAELVPGQVLFQAIPRIDAEQELVLIVRAKADGPGNKRFRVEVSSEELDTQLVAQETTYFFLDAVKKASKAEMGPKRR